VRFVFAVHDHQPVGNFGHVFEQAYRETYEPFLTLLEQYPEIPVSLHTSGPLMEWLAEHKPGYVERLCPLVQRGQVEILGGPFYEPILPMIPPRDRVGQITAYRDYLQGLFGQPVRGMWVPERVWEQNLVSDIADAGMEYTVLDDYHFKQAGLDEGQLFGYYLTEDNGRLLRIFPGSERMRYLIPFRNPEESVQYLSEVAAHHPDAVIVFADDGEKFGSWPGTHKHCYQDRWLYRFLDALRGARSWLRLCTFSQALDETPPAGRIFLPDASYREMTEWAMPVNRREEYDDLIRSLEKDPRWDRLQRFVRGGYWRNFKVRYPETQEMYARMLQVSRLLERSENNGNGDSGAIARARRDLYRAQCNCSWWHGAFGGLYLPHLRNAVYHHLLAAENALLEQAPSRPDWVDAETADFNLDGTPEVCLSNRRLAAYFHPAVGGTLYELDLRPIRHNLLATLARRPEIYHETIRRQAEGEPREQVREQIEVKHTGLEGLLQYDPYLRKSLIDHFYEPTVTLEQLSACHEVELGDFVTAPYAYRVQREEGQVEVSLQRSGQANGQRVRITKHIRLRGDGDALEVHYVLEGSPTQPLFFAVEFNFAGMAAGAEDRYFYHNGHARAGQLQTLQNLPLTDRIGLVDEWLGLDVSLNLSRQGGIWAFPIQTVSRSEGGCEMVHQSTAVLPHWKIEPNVQTRWEVTLTLKLDMSRAESRQPAGVR
jgi:hypothetical protein